MYQRLDGGGAALESLFGRGGGLATAHTNCCKPFGVCNCAVYCGSVRRCRSNRSIHGIDSPGLILLGSGNFKKHLKQKRCTASRPDAGRSFHQVGKIHFVQEGQSLLKNLFLDLRRNVGERERFGLMFLDGRCHPLDRRGEGRSSGRDGRGFWARTNLGE